MNNGKTKEPVRVKDVLDTFSDDQRKAFEYIADSVANTGHLPESYPDYIPPTMASLNREQLDVFCFLISKITKR